MNKYFCKDIFTEDQIFEDSENLLFYCLAVAIEDQGETLNEELQKMLINNEYSLSIEYFINRQDRIMSPLFTRIYDYEKARPIPAHIPLKDTCEKIAEIITTKFLYNWNKLAEAVFSDYNPIDNYNMVENRNTDFEEHTITNNDETVTNKYSGFNSVESSEVSQSVTDGTIDTTKTDTGNKLTNELTRRGNIGVTTTAQMIEGEYKLRKKNLLDLIYSDIDTILFIDYYC